MIVDATRAMTGVAALMLKRQKWKLGMTQKGHEIGTTNVTKF